MAPLIFALKRSGVLRCQKIEKIIHLDRNSISGL